MIAKYIVIRKQPDGDWKLPCDITYGRISAPAP